MILQLAIHHCKTIACFFAIVFYSSIILSVRGAIRNTNPVARGGLYKHLPQHSILPQPPVQPNDNRESFLTKAETKGNVSAGEGVHGHFIGGPGQPEMASFQSVSADKLVNLFTGDFNYNIPLLSVGDYPVNIYYTGDIGPDQEASWCGLGWNINPGNINRNTRGVPDDFNGNDTLTQVQAMKPNKTWGLGIGADLELLGRKTPVEANLGVAFNNYLGPSLDLSVRGNTSLTMLKSGSSEKYSAGARVSVGIDINSRSGTSTVRNLG